MATLRALGGGVKLPHTSPYALLLEEMKFLPRFDEKGWEAVQWAWAMCVGRDPGNGRWDSH